MPQDAVQWSEVCEVVSVHTTELNLNLQNPLPRGLSAAGLSKLRLWLGSDALV